MSNEVVTREPQVEVRQNPLAMVADAVQKGTDPATIKALMDLAERYEANEARKAYVDAINRFKANPPQLYKNKAVSFGAGKTSYKHATLDQVSGVIGSALSAVGISHRWETEQFEGGMIRVTCVLQHVQGHCERVPLQATPDTSGSKNAIQAVGSCVTYLQRYTLLAATGMAVQDQDDDGKQGQKMQDNVKADFLAAIEVCADMPAAEKLWGEIAKAATAAGDIPAYDELKAAMVAKRKAIKAQQQEQTI